MLALAGYEADPVQPRADVSATPSPVPVARPSDALAPTRRPRPQVTSLREPCGAPDAARTVSFRIDIDAGLAATPTGFARRLRSILCHERGWTASGAVRFRYDPAGEVLIGLRTPANAQRRCMELIGLSVRRFYSCATFREIVLNADRWFTGSPYWPGSVVRYRRMLVSHEMGHTLGLGHQNCTRAGAKAPVMMQQSKGLNLNGIACVANPWPRNDELARLGG